MGVQPIAMQAVDLRTQFGTHIVHDGLDFEVYKHEIIGLVGGSGSGKSVLLHTLLGLKEPDGGQIFYEGRNRHHLTSREWRRILNRMGVLFQGGALFSALTVRENIMVPLREHSQLSLKFMTDIADMKIHMVGLPPEAALLYPSDLSGGMRKRAGLARALALDPSLLLLDEPTSGLDPLAASALDELILNLHAALDLTVMMITHDLDSLFRICHRIAVLVDKKIAIADSPDKVVTCDHPWVQAYFSGPRARAALPAKNKG